MEMTARDVCQRVSGMVQEPFFILYSLFFILEEEDVVPGTVISEAEAGGERHYIVIRGNEGE